jgi:hypothetical protein
MRLSKLYAFTTLFSKVQPSLIPAKKICKDCRHFIGDNIECRKFGDINIITGEITYNSARSIRNDINKCGNDAIYFEKNNFKIITIPYYYLKVNWPLSGVLGFYICFLFYSSNLFYLLNKH